VEPQTDYKQYSVYQHHHFAKKVVKFQHFLMKQHIREIHFPHARKVSGTLAVQMKV
jgi:hypothetical protein